MHVSRVTYMNWKLPTLQKGRSCILCGSTPKCQGLMPNPVQLVVQCLLRSLRSLMI
jgi:hypothetical protein